MAILCSTFMRGASFTPSSVNRSSRSTLTITTPPGSTIALPPMISAMWSAGSGVFGSLGTGCGSGVPVARTTSMAARAICWAGPCPRKW